MGMEGSEERSDHNRERFGATPRFLSRSQWNDVVGGMGLWLINGGDPNYLQVLR